MGTVEPTRNNSGDEELRAVRILACISHGKETRLVVLDLEVLIYPRHSNLKSGTFGVDRTLEFLAIN